MVFVMTAGADFNTPYARTLDTSLPNGWNKACTQSHSRQGYNSQWGKKKFQMVTYEVLQ